MGIGMVMRWAVVVAIAAAVALMSPVRSVRADDGKRRAYGEHLAAECTSCHRIDGVDNGVPSITGWPPGDFVTTMGFYASGARDNAVMKSVTGSLDAEQIAALAAYFATLSPPQKKK
jgi:cytochrome c553